MVAAVPPLHALIAAPDLLFLVTLSAMLFRPPEIKFFALDRVAFVLLVFVVSLRALALRETIPFTPRLTFPMLALAGVTLGSVMAQPYEAQTWSVLAAKWLVPFTLFHLAQLAFPDVAARRRFELFAVVVLAYLSFIAIAFFAGATQFIFPRYILNPELGIHADRARGPFLQAVANGVSISLLALVALGAYNGKRIKGIGAASFAVAVPVAILATQTRAVWFGFAVAVICSLVVCRERRIRWAIGAIVITGVLCVLAVLSLGNSGRSLRSRVEERGPLEYRSAVYQAGWQMFLEKPLLGWGPKQAQRELTNRISGFQVENFFLHNTYLELAVQHGLLGLGLYAWITLQLFRLARKSETAVFEEEDFPGAQLRVLWPAMMLAYIINACFVVMNYQFVNGVLFTMAGLLAGQNRRAEELASSS